MPRHHLSSPRSGSPWRLAVLTALLSLCSVQHAHGRALRAALDRPVEGSAVRTSTIQTLTPRPTTTPATITSTPTNTTSPPDLLVILDTLFLRLENATAGAALNASEGGELTMDAISSILEPIGEALDQLGAGDFGLLLEELLAVGYNTSEVEELGVALQGNGSGQPLAEALLTADFPRLLSALFNLSLKQYMAFLTTISGMAPLPGTELGDFLPGMFNGSEWDDMFLPIPGEEGAWAPSGGEGTGVTIDDGGLWYGGDGSDPTGDDVATPEEGAEAPSKTLIDDFLDMFFPPGNQPSVDPLEPAPESDPPTPSVVSDPSYIPATPGQDTSYPPDYITPDVGAYPPATNDDYFPDTTTDPTPDVPTEVDPPTPSTPTTPTTPSPFDYSAFGPAGISNILAMQHDTTMSIINNIGRRRLAHAA